MNKDKKKLINTTYTKQALELNYKIVFNEELNAYICVKHFIKLSMPFRVDDEKLGKVTLIDDGYYIVEYIPLDENYVVRTYIDKSKNVIQNYIDISIENGTKHGMPYYNDLYLDVINNHFGDRRIYLEDESELKQALEEGIVDNEEYNMAYAVANKVVEEIKEGKNVFVNRFAKDVSILEK